MANKICGSLCKLLMICGVLAIVLFATNPSEYEFRQHLKDEINKEAAGKGAVARLLFRSLSSPVVAIATLDLQRQNFYLFSVYHMNIMEDEVVYIGVLGHFIQLKP